MSDPSYWSHSTREAEQFQALVAVGGKAPIQEVTIPSENICNLCRGISDRKTRFDSNTPEENWERSVYPHHKSLVALKKSAKSGCTLCSLIYDAFSTQCELTQEEFEDAINQIDMLEQGAIEVKREPIPLEHTLRSPITVMWTENENDGRNGTLHVCKHVSPAGNDHGRIFLSRIFSSRADKSPFQHLHAVMSGRPSSDVLQLDMECHIEAYTSPDSPLAFEVPNRPIERDPLSNQGLAMIRNWIQSCHDEHLICREKKIREILPTRILDVLPDNLDSEFVRLIQSSGKIGTYACLTYCWGERSTNGATATTSRNFQSYLKKIPISILPRTIYDAIQTCRKLEIRYLWVDALCIIQDSLDDWDKEATAMADIYGKSALTISAIEAAGDTEGFLRRPILYPAQVYWTELITGISGKVSFRLPGTGWQRLLSSRSSLMKRGWTLQERLLSPRILHFGKQTYWECHQSRRSEDGQFDQESTGFEQRLLQQQGDKWMISEYWSNIIEDYSCRSLSEEQDKLVAIAGLARRTKELTGDNYFAGLWQSYLPEGLLWRRKGESFLTSPTSYRAPSWSWAALDGPIATFASNWPSSHIYNDDGRVEMGEFEMEHACTRYRIRCDDHPPESLGKVLYGKIDVQGPIAPSTVNSHNNTNEYILGVDESGSADEREQIDEVGEIIHLETDDRQRSIPGKCVLDKQHRFENQYEISNEWWLLQMVTSIETRKDQSSLMGVRHWAIVLAPQHKVETYDTYKRVGVAFLDVDASVIFEKLNIRNGESGVLNRIWLGHSDNQWCEKRIRLI